MQISFKGKILFKQKKQVVHKITFMCLRIFRNQLLRLEGNFFPENLNNITQLLQTRERRVNRMIAFFVKGSQKL